MAEGVTAHASGIKERKPYRNCADCYLWLATVVVILLYAIFGVVVLILIKTGHLVDSQSFGCLNSQTDFVAYRLTRETVMVYYWTILSLLVCILLVLWIWIKRVHWSLMVIGVSSLIFVMGISLPITWVEESRELLFFPKQRGNSHVQEAPLAGFLLMEIKEFEEQHTNLTLHALPRAPLELPNHNELDCRINDLLRWQVEYKCCGAQSYEEWGSSFPDSCLCEGNITGCVPDGSSFVYETPCLPTVVSLLKKRTSTFWIVMIVWVSLVPSPFALVVVTFFLYCIIVILGMEVEELLYRLSEWWYIKRGGEEMVPVVFLNANNNQIKEENEKGEEKKESDVRVSALEIDDNPLMMIPLSALERMQEELDPPPVQHRVLCRCIYERKGRNFYTVMLEEGSPYLPSGARLADPNKCPHFCGWAEGHHVFFLEDIIWPRNNDSTGISFSL